MAADAPFVTQGPRFVSKRGKSGITWFQKGVMMGAIKGSPPSLNNSKKRAPMKAQPKSRKHARCFLLITFVLSLSSLIGVAEASAQDAGAQSNTKTDSWTVGDLRPNGLRIKPSGRTDASAVLDPQQFSSSEVRRAYRTAKKNPAVLNKLYCWCGCEDRGVHRSNLACFEDTMAARCAVCRGTAEIAHRMVQKGITDAGEIQAAIDKEWGPPENASSK